MLSALSILGALLAVAPAPADSGDVPGPDFMFCLLGPDVEHPWLDPPFDTCAPMDVDKDGDVDLEDFADFVIDHPLGMP